MHFKRKFKPPNFLKKWVWHSTPITVSRCQESGYPCKSQRSKHKVYFRHTYSSFLWMLLEQHPLCHRMCKVTKETSEANKVMRNAIDLTSITLRWTSSSSRQSIFPRLWTGLNDRQMVVRRGEVFIWSKLGQNLSSELLLGERK